MASIQLYTQNATEGLQTFSLAEANLLEATKDTHYTQDFLYKTTNPTTQEDVWSVNISIPLAGMDYVSPNKNYQPLPHYQLIDHDGYFYPDYVNPSAAALTSEPSDWELHWRDYYTENPHISWEGDSKRYYYGVPLYPNASNVPPTWETNTFYKTNQVRHLYWTMDGNYFPLIWGWFDFNNSVYYGLQFAWAPYGKYNVNWDAHWENVNNPRFAGVSGPLVYGNSGNGENYFSFLHNYGSHYNLSNTIDPRVYFNFIGFKYKFIDTSGEEPVEKTEEFIGLIAWEESIDGIPQSAKIVGLSKSFFGARKKPANGGPISGIQGGNGTFSAPSDNRGDKRGVTATQIATAWGSAYTVFSTNFNNYFVKPNDTDGKAAFATLTQQLFNPNASIWNDLENLILSPLDCIIACHAVPQRFVPVTGTLNALTVRGKVIDSDHLMRSFGTYCYPVNVGYIDIDLYTDGFDDYTNTSIILNLPYVGVKQIDVSSCMRGWLAVDYIVDLYTGDCTAIVTVSDYTENSELRYQYKGSVAKAVYLKQVQSVKGAVTSAIAPIAVSIGASAIGGVATGMIASSIANKALETPVGSGLGTAEQRVMSGALAARAGAQASMTPINMTQAVSNATTSLATSATQAALGGAATLSCNASGGAVTSPIDTQCWALITRPQRSNPAWYDIERAYPSDISGQIKDFQGFLVVSEAELNDIDCTDTERTEIMQRLVSGVYVSEVSH